MAENDPLSAALAEIRHDLGLASHMSALHIGSQGERLLAALDAVLAPHSPRTDPVLGSSCFTHRTTRSSMVPVPGCGDCVQDGERVVCPECRDEFMDPVPFGDCRAGTAALAALTGKAEGT